MTIPIMSSKELNEQFLKSKDKIDELKIDINNIKNDIGKKLMITNYAYEYASRVLNSLSSGVVADEKMYIFDKSSFGEMNQYGQTVHPKFKKNPIDIFNLKLLSGDSMFREALTAKVNNVENKDYLKVIMSENNIDKKIIFEELNEDTITLEYELDNTVALGMSRFNMIEIDPYLYGAYDIIEIQVFVQDEAGELETEPYKRITGIENIGKTRIILDEKVKFAKVKLTFKVNFETEINSVKVYPFGLKHIYFLEADFVINSYAVLKVTSDRYIEYVYNDIKLYTTSGIKEITCDEYGIELYTDYNYNDLSGRIYPSSDAGVNRIAKNTKSFYAKIPLIKKNIDTKTIEYLSLNGVRFNFVDEEQILI